MHVAEPKAILPIPKTKLLRSVNEYSDLNENLRQKLISGSYQNAHDGDQKALQVILHLLYTEVDYNTRRLCPTYQRGLWAVDANGFLALTCKEQTHRCTAIFMEHTVSPDELAYAMSVMSWQHLAMNTGLPERLKRFCSYMFHLGHVLLESQPKNTKAPRLSANKIIDILD